MPHGNNWDVELYEARHSFVWKLGSALIDLLEPRAGERIVDLGCGSGQLTASIASSGAYVIGIDSSPAMIAQARANYPHLEFRLADAREFELSEPVQKVFSNAALHWVRDAGLAASRIAAALLPGGKFVAEFGGDGNVATIVAAMEKEIGPFDNPWYFPSVHEYVTVLENVGLEVSAAELFDRMTPLEGANGMQDWLEMFAEPFFSGIPPVNRAEVRDRIAARLRPSLFNNGTWHADYRRLRVMAIKRQ